MVDRFGLKLNVNKTKVIWSGKWSKKKTKPLQQQWTNEPVKILGVQFSYDENKSKLYNIDLKIPKLQTKLDLWKAIKKLNTVRIMRKTTANERRGERLS